MKKMIDKIRRRKQRKMHIRKNISGTAQTPRMSVFRSNKHISIQIIDDTKASTLTAISTLEKDLRTMKSNKVNAEKLGELLGERLIKLDIKNIVFDRNGYKYHGIIKAVADGARKAGIQF